MELFEALAQRRMCRSFLPRAIEPELLQQCCDLALHAPTAGHSCGVDLVLLTAPEARARYWSAATDERWRASAPRAPGLMAAGALAVVVCSPAAYVERYAAADKADPVLGGDEASWPIPYWYGDAGGVVVSLLLAAEAAGLGACFHGAFRGRAEVESAVSLPATWSWYGTVLLGHRDPTDRRSRSLERPHRRAERLHLGRFGS